VEKFQKDERYLNLTSKVSAAIETLNEYESLDLLFWMRKFRIYRIETNIPDERVEKFFLRLE